MFNSLNNNNFGDVMVSMLTTSVVDLDFEPRSGQAKDYEIGICCFSAKHAALRSKSIDWLTRDSNNVFKWSGMYNHGLFCQ